MKPKLKKISLIFLVTLFIIFTFYFLYYIQGRNSIVKSSVDPILVPIKETLHEVQQEKDFQKLSKEEKLEKTYQVVEQLPTEYKTLKRQYQIALSTLPDITFYGRVIDQYGQPVVGANVGYEGTNTYLSAGGVPSACPQAPACCKNLHFLN